MVLGVNRNQPVNNAVNHRIENHAPQLREEYSASLKSFSSEQLKEAMGNRSPKSDIKIGGFTLYARSTEYKQTLGKLDEFKNQFAELAEKPVGNLNKNEIALLKETLQTASDFATQYQDKHAGSETKAPRREVMEHLKSAIGQQMIDLDKLFETKGNFSNGTTVGDALAVLNTGLNSSAILENTHKGQKLESHRVLGQGAVNTVILANFKNEDDSVEQRVLKPLTKQVEELGGFEKYFGMRNENAKIGERNIASASVAHLLGLGDMIPKPSVTVFEGQVCLDMPLAPGQSAQQDVMTPCDQQWTAAINQRKDVLANASPEEKPRKQSEFTNFLANNGITRTGPDEFGIETFMKKGQSQLALPIVSPQPNALTANLQKALMNMQLLDALCGQVDRHMGNFFVKITGDEVVLTGIDNDGSFGENEKCGTNTLVGDANFQHACGLPPVMTRESANMLASLTPDAFKSVLVEAGLEPKEIGLALLRLDNLKNHAINLDTKNLVTDDFLGFTTKQPGTDNDWTMNDFLSTTTRDKTNYVHKFNDIQLATVNLDGIPLIPLQIEQN